MCSGITGRLNLRAIIAPEASHGRSFSRHQVRLASRPDGNSTASRPAAKAVRA